MCVVLGEREASQPLDMTDYIRIINIPWFVVLFPFWLFRFKEPSTDRNKTACQRRSPGWYFNRLGELLGVGYLTGFGFGYFAETGSWMGWAGEEDVRLPGWCWVIGLGFGLFNFACQHFSRDGRASRIASMALIAALIFCNISVIMHWREQGYKLLDWPTFIVLIIVGAEIVFSVISNWIAKFLPADVVLSLCLPLTMLFMIYGVEVFPAPNQNEFVIATCVGAGLIFLRIVIIPFFIKPETMCCVESNMDTEDQVSDLKKDVKSLKNKVNKKSKKKPKKSLIDNFTESFDDAYTAAKKRQQNNGWEHDYELASTTITSEDPESEGEESVVWGVIPPRDPFDEADQ